MNPMNPMGLAPYCAGPLQWAPPPLPSVPPPTASFWTASNVTTRLKELQDTLNLAKAMQKELEMLVRMKEKEGTTECEGGGEGNGDIMSMDRFSKFMKDNQIEFEFQESMSLNTANAIISKLRFQLEPFRVVTDGNTPWEEKSAVKRLADKVEKYKRNKLWRKRKRRRIAENLARECKQFDKKDKEADEWRAKETAKEVAQQKVEKMKEIAKLKEKEKRRLESEFLERVRAAVEEEERQSMAAADAKDAIANAEESTKHIHSRSLNSEKPDLNNNSGGDTESQDQPNQAVNEGASIVVAQETEKHVTDGPGPASGSVYDSVANLPMEFYHYYHGSSTDMGTLIEVRRTWDAYLRPGGSRIPGHWVQPPPPADDIWASYLVKPKQP
ncbi:U11/U12 small nuclear ribonucleoprotein 59 kDa protein [Phtheirospermum japonicum]|uniref:U11/U12 small nuclear ribonucleoprotein 59 kDa protein n=1 Tax=Phtheirospermum japonicum TaxID=374723 RepID=A0A830BU19_9LAMI|nr:U11/U12 small nuclear ribonucleoprotein 59 kDa protein [Phtheirospermum japonicum]